MLTVSNSQQHRLDAIPQGIFVEKAKKYICDQNLCPPEKERELDHFLHDVIAFCNKHAIRAEINVLNLAILFLTFPIPKRLHAEQIAILKNTDWDEHKRTEEFYLLTTLNG